MVRTAGADILFDTLVVGAIVPDRIQQELIIESKSGREAVLAKAFVDSTGDADVAALSGASVLAAERKMHNLCFRLGNVEVDRQRIA